MESATVLTKICCYCGVEKPLDEYPQRKNRKKNPYQPYCKECDKVNARKRWAELAEDDPQRLKHWKRGINSYYERVAKGLCFYCYQPVSDGQRYCDICRTKRAERERKLRATPERIEKKSKWNFDTKLRILAHYSGGNTPSCICCHESELVLLTLDHVNNDGTLHRTEEGYRFGGTRFYRWLEKHGLPDGFQVMCYTCNCGKSKTRHQDHCPHFDKRLRQASVLATI